MGGVVCGPPAPLSYSHTVFPERGPKFPGDPAEPELPTGPAPTPRATPQQKSEPHELNHLCPPLTLCGAPIHQPSFPVSAPSALPRPLLGRGDEGEWGREGLLTVAVAASSSSATLQPACSRPRPSTWHCSTTSSPTSTEALGIWIFSLGTSDGPECSRGVRAGPGLRTLPRRPLPHPPQSLSCPVAMPPALSPPSNRLLPMPVPQPLSALASQALLDALFPSTWPFPSLFYHLQHLPQLVLDKRTRGPCPGHRSFCSRTLPSPSSSQRSSQCRAQEQSRGFPDRTLEDVGDTKRGREGAGVGPEEPPRMRATVSGVQSGSRLSKGEGVGT